MPCTALWALVTTPDPQPRVVCLQISRGAPRHPHCWTSCRWAVTGPRAEASTWSAVCAGTRHQASTTVFMLARGARYGPAARAVVTGQVNLPERLSLPSSGPDNTRCGIPWLVARPFGPCQAPALDPPAEDGFRCQACPAGHLRH